MRTSLNLMSQQSRRHACIRRCLRRWCGIFAALVGLTALLTLERYLVLQSERQNQLALEAKYEPLAALKKSNSSLKSQIEAIHREEQFVLALSRHEPTITLLGVLASAVSENESRVFLQKIELNRVLNGATTQGEASSVLELAGVANSGSVVKQFADSLQKSLSFGKVDVTNSKEYRMKQQLLHDFNVQCNF